MDFSSKRKNKLTHNILPYKILALGPFIPVPDASFKPNFVNLDLYSIDDALKAFSPVFYLPVSEKICSEGALTLTVDRMKAFKPKSMIQNNSFLKSLLNGKKRQPAPGESHVAQKQDRDSRTRKESAAVDDILSMVSVSEPPSGTHDGKPDVDDKIRSVMEEFFSRDEFIKAESAWRGVQSLVRQADIKGSERINVTISAVSHDSLEHVLNIVKSLPHDQLPNLVLIDLDFDNTLPSIELIEQVIQFSDTMMIPTCIELKPQFFRIDSWTQLNKLPYINHYLDDISYAKFKKLKSLGGAPVVMACINRFAVRDANEYEYAPLLASPVWSVGTLCAKAVNESGWPIEFSRYTHYQLDNLPVFSMDGKKASGVQALFPDEKILQLAEAGITSLVGAKNRDVAFIPKETSLAGSSIRFQMFFNRILEAIVNFREQNDSDPAPEKGIKQAITEIFLQTGHDQPEHLSVALIKKDTDNQNTYFISLLPPSSVISTTDLIEFSFIW